MKKPALSFEWIEPLFGRIASLSKVQRLLITAGIFLLIGAAFVMLSYLPKYQEISDLKEKQEKLERQLRIAKRVAGQQRSFQQKMTAAQVQFEQAKKALPEKEDIPSLLADISASGQEAGLEFLLFQPKAEAQQEFFAEIPIEMKLDGRFHQVALFFDKVSRLSRIVNLKSIQMQSINNYEKLITDCTAVTYRFVEAPPPKKVVRPLFKKKTDKKK